MANQLFSPHELMDPDEYVVDFVIPTRDEFSNLLHPHYVPSLWHVAVRLSGINRYSGGCRPFYSVAYHSYVVSKCVKFLSERPEDQIYALLHDAGEMFSGDIPSPIKKMAPEIVRFENTIVNKIIDRHFSAVPFLSFDKQCREVVSKTERLIAHVEMETFLQSFVKPYLEPESQEEELLVDHARLLLTDNLELGNFGASDFLNELHRYRKNCYREPVKIYI